MAVKKRYPQAILATALLPWTDDDVLDEGMFREEIRYLVGAGIRHIYVFGTAGEGYDLRDDEFRHIVQVFQEEMDGPGLYPMVCVLSLSTRQVLERVEMAYRLGIRAFQLALPSWGALKDAEIKRYFHDVCDRYPDCSFMIYNIGRSGRVLELPQFMRLAEEIPNLVAAKHTQPNLIQLDRLLRSDCPLRFFLAEGGWAYGALVGECGYLAALGVANPKLAHRYFEAGLRKDSATLFSCQAEMLDVVYHLLEVAGDAMDGAYDKITMKLALPRFPLRLRGPYTSPTEEAFARHRDYVREHFPHWNV